jgi:hypothetical protein
VPQSRKVIGDQMEFPENEPREDKDPAGKPEAKLKLGAVPLLDAKKRHEKSQQHEIDERSLQRAPSCVLWL